MGDELSSTATLFEISAPANPLPTAAPAAGVITKWKVTLVPAPVTLPHTLKVLRVTGPATVQNIGEASGNVGPGVNTFDARIPVQTGDRLGLFSPTPEGTLVCEGPGPPGLIGGFEGSGGGVGSSTPFVEVPTEVRIPVAAIIEPDADNDGFGDETQDKCPQSAAIQTECPVVTLDATPIVKKGSVILLVTASSIAPVTVSASARIPNAVAKSSALTKLKGQTKVVKPGKVVRFRLGFSKALRSALKALPASKTVKLKTVTSAKNVAGQVTKKRINLRLKGQG